MNKILRNTCAVLLFGVATSGWGTECVLPPAGLVSWWPGEGDANDIVGGQNGTLINGVRYVSGIVGQAFHFDDTTSAYISVPDSPSLNIGTGDFSMDAWIKTNSSKEINSIQDKRTGPGYVGYHFFVDYGYGPNVQFTGDTNGTDVRAHRFLADGQLHHVAVSVRRNATNGIRLFLDGELVLTADPPPDSGSLDTNVPLLIGGHSYLNENCPYCTFNGLVDEFDLFKRALTDDEVKAIYAAGSAGKCRGPSFANFSPRAEFTLGPKANDDSYWVRGWLRLADTSNGIDPLTEAVTIKVGPFSHTLPVGSFTQDGASYLFKGPVGSSVLDVRITGSSIPGGYSFKSCLKNGSLGATTMEPQVQLSIGDEQGQATLDVGYAKFGTGKHGQNWVFPQTK